jgi:hypothetical protein
LRQPGVPSIGHPIDAFVRAHLRKAGIESSPPADRRILIRRVYFDLHGLPPTPEAVQDFVQDRDPNAWEIVVDELLASPRYGERWARHWLDAIHFADSHGCEHDVLRPNAWRFRDYVITRLNQDVSWGRFIREQLAADVFYPEDSRLIAGLGFIAAGPMETSRAGTAPVTFDYLDRDDMVAQTMAAFVSTTANCARCHTHKFDPITQADYYSLQAVFAGVGKGDVAFDTDLAVAEQRRKWMELKSAAEAGRKESLLAEEHAKSIMEWERARAGAAVWQPLPAEVFLSAEGSGLQREADGSVYGQGTRPETDTYTITGTLPVQKLSAIRLDVFSDDRLPFKGPGRQDNGNLHLTEFEAQFFAADEVEPVKIKIRQATADWNQEGWTISHALDGDVKTAWGIYPKVGESHYAVFELEVPLEVTPGSKLGVLLKQLHGAGHVIGRFQLQVTDAPGGAAEVLPEAVRIALETPANQRSEEQRRTIAQQALREQAEQALAKLPPMSQVFAASSFWSHAKKLDRPAAPKVVHVLKRGDIEKPGEVANPGALSAIKALPGRFALGPSELESARRAALADWLASEENPLTWRSAVNRAWHFHFGLGLCDTPNDFGRMGGVPSHPELIDWLAVWFRDEARGSLKQLHRLILTSETWQQSAGHANAVAIEQDAENRLLWRMHRRRMDAESFRDALLQISGRLDLRMGGPGIEQFVKSKGPQATPSLDYAAYDWGQANAARRSIYRVVWRGIADPFMEAMDFPDMALLSPKRGSSVSALQALTVYNNDFVLHHCESYAERLAKQSSDLNAQVREAVRTIHLRDTADVEQVALVAYAQEHGLAALLRVLFNSNEFLYVD